MSIVTRSRWRPLAAGRRGLGISGRATLLILAIACAAFVACSTYLYVSQSALLRRDIDLNVANLSTATAGNVGNWLRGKLDLMRMMAHDIAATGLGSEADRVLDAPVLSESFYVRYVGRQDGFYTKFPKAVIPPGYDPRKRPWYKEAVAMKGAILTEPYMSASRGTMVLTAAAPIEDMQHALLG